MLSVNKKFNDPIFFQRALQRKYPFLLEFKTEDVSWRQFYVSMIYYISKLEEIFSNQPVIYVVPEPFNPRKIQIGSLLWHEAVKAALASNDLGLITFFTDKLGYKSDSLQGFLLPLFVRQPIIDFIRNANFDHSLKEVLRPLLKAGVFSYAILTQLFILYLKINLLEIQENPRHYRVDENMNKYLAPYLDELESKGKFDRNNFRYPNIPSIFLLGTYKEKERKLDDKTQRLLFGLNKVLIIVHKGLNN